MSQSLYHRWSVDIRRQKVFGPGERVGVAVSGGPDSVLLLYLMVEFSGEAGLALSVVHFNHQLRGAESAEDERFVLNLAQNLKLPFLIGRARTADEARHQHKNLEATARQLRYQFFVKLLREGRFDKLATAHTLDDQAETVLLRLLRGTGGKGLGGIYPSIEGKIIRPLLGITRAEVEAEIASRGLEFRTDSSNANTRFRRNKIRRELLPMIEREFNPEIKNLLAQTAALARDEENYLEQQTRERINPWRVRDNGVEKITRRALASLPPALARRALRQMVQSVKGDLRGVTHVHIELLYRFALESQSGRKLLLSKGLVASNDFDWLTLGLKPEEHLPHGFAYPVIIPGSIVVRETGRALSFRILDAGAVQPGYNQSKEREWPRLPLNLPEGLVLRSWRQGDRYQPAGYQRSQKVKELFSRRKIPVRDRLLWPVLDSAQGIVCVRGFPAAEWAGIAESGEMIVVEESPPVPWAANR